eukprot:gene3370-biopygen2182
MAVERRLRADGVFRPRGCAAPAAGSHAFFYCTDGSWRAGVLRGQDVSGELLVAAPGYPNKVQVPVGELLDRQVVRAHFSAVVDLTRGAPGQCREWAHGGACWRGRAGRFSHAADPDSGAGGRMPAGLTAAATLASQPGSGRIAAVVGAAGGGAQTGAPSGLGDWRLQWQCPVCVRMTPGDIVVCRSCDSAHRVSKREDASRVTLQGFEG